MRDILNNNNLHPIVLIGEGEMIGIIIIIIITMIIKIIIVEGITVFFFPISILKNMNLPESAHIKYITGM